MRKFVNVAAQGEITIRRVDRIPAGCSAMQSQDGRFIIGHSETGHHHTIDAKAGTAVSILGRPPAGMRILYALLTEPTLLEHLRPHDTHEPLLLEPGAYEFRIAREYDPYAELARMQAD